MPEPIVIQGPGYVERAGLFAYMDENGHMVKYQRESWEPKGSMSGGLGPRNKATRIVVSGRPVGEYETLTGYWPYVAGDIGSSIFSATALKVAPKAGNKITFPRSGVSKLSSLYLGPLKTVWGEMEWTCLGDAAKEPTAIDYRQVIAAIGIGEGAANVTFDQTKVISPRVTASWGAIPFDVLETEEGWQIEPSIEVKWMYGATHGLLDGILVSLGVTAMANIINLTEAQYATMMRLQDADAVRPGDTYSNPASSRNLIISATGVSATLFAMGVENADLRYQAGGFRQGPVKFVHRRTWTGGVADSIWTLA